MTTGPRTAPDAEAAPDATDSAPSPGVEHVTATADGVDVPWETAREANRLNWDDRAVLHETSYGLDAVDDPEHVSDVVADDLPVLERHAGPLAGRDLLHLQCHIGTDTISLARAGARVTGLDQSPASLDAARRLAERTGTDARWVESDALTAATALAGHDFDVVYTSIGALCWLDDLDVWAGQVAAVLRPGGVLYARDGHPMLYTIDETRGEVLVRYRYFGDGRAQVWDDPGTYAGDGTVAHARTYEWPHPLLEVVQAVLDAGLALERLDEGRILPWRFAPRMVEVAPGRWAFPGAERDRLPCTFTIVARRPGA